MGMKEGIAGGGYLGSLEVVDRQMDKQEDRQASNDPGTQEKQVDMPIMRNIK